MKALYEFSHDDKSCLEKILSKNTINPYTQYQSFKDYIATFISEGSVPQSLVLACRKIVEERTHNGVHVHILKNCPIDSDLPELDLDNPVRNKYEAKKTFIGEGFLEIMSQLQGTPLFSYQKRNNGDYFTDLVSFNKFRGKKTGFTDGDLIYHSDRSYHTVRADYVSLLGLRVNESELIYTNYMDVKDLKEHLDSQTINLLSQEIFLTDVDDLSRENNQDWESSTRHAIFIDDDKIRYQDTFTRSENPDDIESIRALLKLKNAMSKAKKLRHQVKKGELLIFGNQTGIHNREWIDVINAEEGRKRWLLKTYSFSNEKKSREYSEWATHDDALCIMDK